MTRIKNSSMKLVSGVGFSYGCAPLALKKPPPLVPRFLMASCDATGPCAMVCFPPSTVVAAVDGFFNANGAHPYENPTPLTNFIELFLILVIPAALTYTFGRMVRDTRQGWAILCAFMVMALAGVFVCYGFEQAGNPILAKLGIQSAATSGQAGGNMEGKEVRNGVVSSTLFATVTTDTSCGAVNNMHDSLTPIAGLVPMLNMMTDIVIFGGVGAGLYGILIYCIIAVFIAGLMVGRTPEYLGKKLE